METNEEKETIEEIRSNVKTITNIMIFFAVIVVIQIIVGFYFSLELIEFINKSK